MAGWGENWAFDWGNPFLAADVTTDVVLVTAQVPAPVVTSPSATIANPATIPVLANVRVPLVSATIITTFNPDQPFAIYRAITAGSAVARNVTTPAGV